MSRLGQANTALTSFSQTTNVSTTTLDTFCACGDLRPNWILMDIEGYELQALRGARALLARCPDLQLVVEMHPSIWSATKTSVDGWHEFLNVERLHAIPLTGQKDPFAELGSVYLKRELEL